jgi:hypothetical protein
MDRFIRRENVKHYKDLLKSATSDDERQRLLKLLAEEQQKQREAGDKVEESHCRGRRTRRLQDRAARTLSSHNVPLRPLQPPNQTDSNIRSQLAIYDHSGKRDAHVINIEPESPDACLDMARH